MPDPRGKRLPIPFMNSIRIRLVLPSLLLAAGIGLAGNFIGRGIADRNTGRRTIAVRGLSEKEVPASLAIWTIGFQATSDKLTELDQQLGASSKAVVAFLKQAGFEDQEIAVQPPSVRDTRTEVRSRDAAPPPERYAAQQAVLLRSSKVERVKPALASVSSLILDGVLLSSGSPPNYIFNQLNEIKPGMIQEATQNARIAAEQFAHDSQTVLGSLHNASQGGFQIEDRDAASPEWKMVRVVVHVEYAVK